MLILCIKSFAQEHSDYFTLPQYQKYIGYLINSGNISIAHPLSQPFFATDINNQIKKDAMPKHWCKLLKDELQCYIQDSSNHEKGDLTMNLTSSFGLSDENKSYNKFGLGSIGFSYLFKNTTFHYNYEVDTRYQYDTLYFGSLGKLENKNWGRTSEAYINYDGKYTSFFCGRMSRNFGFMSEPSLILSNNPFSYDHLLFQFHNSLLKFTSMFSRLNDIYGYDIRDTLKASSWNTRFLNVHRLEIAVSKNLEVALSESVLYGGKDKFPQLQYFNPLNVFYLSKMSDRKGYEETNANSLLCFEIYYKPQKKITFYSQVLVDDMDFTKSLRATFPDRVGFTSKIIYCNLFPFSQMSLTYNIISNWSYNSFYTWGNYTFYGNSIGYPKHGTESLCLQLDIYSFSPIIVNSSIVIGRQRKQNLDTAFIAVKSEFPIAPVEYYIKHSTYVSFFPHRKVKFDFMFDIINVKQFNECYTTYLNAKVSGSFMINKKFRI